MLTIYDISKETGYSVATVSKVINNYKGVSKKAQSVIKEKIKELGFSPNNSARTLVTKKSWLIAIIFDDEQDRGITHPHYSNIIEEFRREVISHGYDIVFLNTKYGDNDVTYYEHCRLRDIDGIVIAKASPLDEKTIDLINCDIPIISIEGIYENIATVISDNRQGAKIALNYLYSLGHRKIAHIAAPLTTIAGQERSEQYIDFILDMGLAQNLKYHYQMIDYSKEEVLKVAYKLLSLDKKERPTAIYVAYDEFAYTLIEELHKFGIRVPQDISIIGNDDLPISQYINGGLTSVRQNRKDIGKISADILLKQIKDNNETNAKPYPHRIKTELIIRNSTQKVEIINI